MHDLSCVTILNKCFIKHRINCLFFMNQAFGTACVRMAVLDFQLATKALPGAANVCSPLNNLKLFVTFVRIGISLLILLSYQFAAFFF